MTDVDHAAALRRLLNGFQVSQAIHVAASLGIADLLSSGPCDTDALAAATDTDPGSLYRLLRALAAFGLFTESDGRTFALTEMGQLLRSDVGESLAGWASFIGRPYYWNAWTYLGDSVRTGRNAFRTLHGVSAWEYRASHPEESAIFDRGMTSLTQLVTAAVVATYDFGRFRQIADIGGGSGTLLAAVLAAAPSARGVLYDQPHVVATLDPALRADEVAPRVEVMGGDFFTAVPGGCDAYLLKSVLHDWSDADAMRILASCRAAATDTTTVLVVERVLVGPNEGPDGKLSDLNMLVGPGGQERTVEEFATLFAGAGFALARTIPTGSTVTILEATTQ